MRNNITHRHPFRIHGNDLCFQSLLDDSPLFNELKNRGVKDILIACIDGLQGFPDAIKTVFPETRIQLCIIHQIRNTMKYIAYKDSKAFMKDLKRVYGAESEEIAYMNLEAMKDSWKKYRRV